MTGERKGGDVHGGGGAGCWVPGCAPVVGLEMQTARALGKGDERVGGVWDGLVSYLVS